MNEATGMSLSHLDPERGERWSDADFEIAAALKDATGAAAAPASLYRVHRWRRSVALLTGALLSLVIGAWAFVAFVYPPEIVREALAHERGEATLRGDYQSEKRPMLAALNLQAGAVLPGLLQLQRPCEIGGRLAYHVTTFVEKGGGMVTILAFAQPLPHAPTGSGQWLGHHWRFVSGTPGKTILLVADNARVLADAEHWFRGT